jgi:hypothetical protein
MGALAAVFIPSFVVALVVLVFVALLRDRRLRWQLALRAARRAGKRAVIRNASRPVSASEPVENPMWASRRTSVDGAGGEPLPQPPPDDPVLAPFLSEYLYAAFYFKHLDLLCLAVLAVLQVRVLSIWVLIFLRACTELCRFARNPLQGSLPRPTTTLLVGAKAGVACFALLCLLLLVAFRRPFSVQVRTFCQAFNGRFSCRN